MGRRNRVSELRGARGCDSRERIQCFRGPRVVVVVLVSSLQPRTREPGGRGSRKVELKLPFRSLVKTAFRAFDDSSL